MTSASSQTLASVALLLTISGTASSAVEVPFEHGLGQALYEENCGSCHGVSGNGSEQGPPLMHKVYLASHHGDQSFYRAALKGARAHHWPFGDMAPVPGMTRKKLDKIVPYVRWLQSVSEIK